MKRTAAVLAALLPGAFLLPYAQAAPPAALEPAAAKKPAMPAKPMKKSAVPPALANAKADDALTLLKNAPKAADYPNAAKATLLDLADITVHPDGTTRTITRQTLKIFNKRGRDDEAEVRIPYNASYDTVKILRARTIRPNGKIVSVDLAHDVRDSTLNAGYNTYDDSRAKSFSMPAVEDGCIIDYEYETTEKEAMIPGQFWTRWYFQSGVDPVVLTRLTVTAPKTMKLQTQLQKTSVVTKKRDLPDGKNVLYTWEDKNVSAFVPEPMMPDAETLLPKLTVSTLGSWQAIADWYHDLAKTRMEADPETRARAIELTKNLKTPEEKAKAIFYYVQDKTRYVSIDFGKSAYQPHTPTSVLGNQYGDCKDMATLLVAMLRAVGIDSAYPVLLNAESKTPKGTQLPTPSAFNHAICLVEMDGKKYWLDATAEVCPWGVIPSGDRGADAFVMRNGKGAFETIPVGTPSDNQTKQSATLALAPDGSAKGVVTLTGTGDTDMGLRGALLVMPPDKMRPFMESIAKKLGTDAKVTDYKVSDFRNKDVPVSISMDVYFPNWANQSGDLLLFKARPEQTGGAASSPFGEDGRRLAISQDSTAAGVSTLELTLPTGYSVLSLPKNAEVKSDLGRFERTVSQNNGKILISTTGENYQATVPASGYDAVRAYYENYLKASGESIIVKKN